MWHGMYVAFKYDRVSLAITSVVFYALLNYVAPARNVGFSRLGHCYSFDVEKIVYLSQSVSFTI